jgi:hypothetical protein
MAVVRDFMARQHIPVSLYVRQLLMEHIGQQT